jgi:hypothetical protein
MRGEKGMDIQGYASRQEGELKSKLFTMESITVIDRNKGVPAKQCVHNESYEITFSSGEMLSIIRGDMSYGGPSLYEIWPSVMVYDEDAGCGADDPLGWLTVDDVLYYVRKMRG